AEELLKQKILRQLKAKMTLIRAAQRVLFVIEMQRELVKREDAHIEQRELLLDAQEPFHTVTERIGGNDNSERSERIGGFELPDLLNQGELKVGVERTGDNAEHGSREARGYGQEAIGQEVHFCLSPIAYSPSPSSS
ncbi:MAG: hypothetical protein AAB093_01160, partial [Nitrospirota bacterium]